MALNSIPIQPDAARDAKARALVSQVKTWHTVTLKQPWGSFPAGTVCRQTPNGYRVNSVACQCDDYQRFGHICKHVRAIVLWERRNDDIDTEIALAFAELATSKRGDRAGAAIIKTYESIWGAEDD